MLRTVGWVGRRRCVVLGAFVVAVLSVAGCGGGESVDAGDGRPKPTVELTKLVWDKPQEIEGIDPAVTSQATSWQLFDLVYDSLVRTTGEKIVPELAESWTNPDPRTYVFALRQGVKFSNGRELTADDVVGSLKRLIAPDTASYWASQLGDVKSISAPDDDHVKVVLRTPQTPFLAALAGASAAILPMKELESGEFDPTKELLGTGPYTVKSHVQDRDWQFVANPHYWKQGEPTIEALQVNIVTEEATRIANLRTGASQIATFENASAPQLLEGVANVKTVIQPTTDYWVLDLNAKSSLFQDVRLRHAVALALDRQEIAQTGLSGVGEPAPPSAPGLAGSCDTDGLPYYQPDLDKARELVEQAGATGQTVELIASPTFANIPLIGQMIEQQLGEIGLKVKLVSLGGAEWTDRVYSGKADFDADISFFAGYADPGMVLAWWNPDFAVFNKAWLEGDPELTGLIRTELTTPNGPERAEALAQACERVAEGANMLPLVTKPQIVAYREDQLIAEFAPIEGYSIPLKDIATYGP